MRAFVGTIHDVFVGPLEIERIDQRFANAPVLELLTSRIDEPTLRARRRVVGQHVAFDAAVPEGREIVARRPKARGEFLAEKIVSRSEAFEADLAVPIVLEAHYVEIVLPTGNRKIATPPILDPLELDEMPNLETTHLVGTAAEGDVEGRLVERFFRIVGTREDRQGGNEQRHVTRANLGKARDNGAIVGGLRVREVAQLLGNDRVALFL
jgi:hypothetical protein